MTVRSQREYLNGWVALTRMMHQGKSWSGRERHCGYLNLGDGRFANVSAIGGLDTLDDGRSMASTDWDGDGDLDVWLRNRTGPQLRFLRNQNPADSAWVAFKLIGRSCNRDAVGARVEVRAAGKTMSRVLAAGDGYLSQSSKWLHFGLGTLGPIEGVKITWPGGKQQIVEGVTANRRYVITQDAGPVESPGRSDVGLEPSAPKKTEPSGSARIVLRVPLPMPPSVTRMLGTAGATRSPKLINIWAQWCEPCVEELGAFSANRSVLAKTGLEIVATNVDDPKDRDKAARLFSEIFGSKTNPPGARLVFAEPDLQSVLQAVLEHVRDIPESWPLPTSFLVDQNGAAQVIYLGPVSSSRLAADAETYGGGTAAAHRRSLYPGRWQREPDVDAGREHQQQRRELGESQLGDEALRGGRVRLHRGHR